ncbi:protein zntD-like, partial [Homarus americanus]|uniref:protein zntD-like n=1 Tax=Homarus americanus TaxID=6706 RepID=UPI001C46B919
LGEARDPRGLDQLTRCIKMAEPLVKNPDNIFPLTIPDIDRVCKLWDDFVYCVKDYTVNYLSSTQRQDFNSAIESSLKSVNQLCVEDPEYRRSYLENAPCLKRVSINTTICGGYYSYLADLVQGNQATDAQMCCAHHKFRECLLDKTPMECDADGRGSTSQFMRSMLDRALGFLLQKCKNFVPNARDCPRGNFGVPTSPTNTDYNHNNNHNNHNNNHNNHNNNNYGHPGSDLRPDITTSQSSPPSSTYPTTRFTWTTAATGPSPRPTSSPNVNLAGNSLFGAESQQYRDSGSSVVPALTTLILGLAVVFRLY